MTINSRLATAYRVSLKILEMRVTLSRYTEGGLPVKDMKPVISWVRGERTLG